MFQLGGVDEFVDTNAAKGGPRFPPVRVRGLEGFPGGNERFFNPHSQLDRRLVERLFVAFDVDGNHNISLEEPIQGLSKIFHLGAIALPIFRFERRPYNYTERTVVHNQYGNIRLRSPLPLSYLVFVAPCHCTQETRAQFVLPTTRTGTGEIDTRRRGILPRRRRI